MAVFSSVVFMSTRLTEINLTARQSVGFIQLSILASGGIHRVYKSMVHQNLAGCNPSLHSSLLSLLSQLYYLQPARF